MVIAYILMKWIMICILNRDPYGSGSGTTESQCWNVFVQAIKRIDPGHSEIHPWNRSMILKRYSMKPGALNGLKKSKNTPLSRLRNLVSSSRGGKMITSNFCIMNNYRICNL